MRNPAVLHIQDEAQGVGMGGELACFDEPDDHVLFAVRVLRNPRRFVVVRDVEVVEDPRVHRWCEAYRTPGSGTPAE